MTTPYIIAEAAQGYEGSAAIAKLLVRAAANADADAIKFQIIFADDLAVPGYPYYGLFSDLEMSAREWGEVRTLAGELGLAFVADVFGPHSVALANELALDAVKIHTTCFYETTLIRDAISREGRIYLSIGGIPLADVEALFHDELASVRDRVTVLYGYQSEPTPLDRNNLLRIPELRRRLDCDIGFMDHSDGASDEIVTLSAMALALGVSTFEKHITLDRALELEDYVSALAPEGFADYVTAIRKLHPALGTSDLEITEEELTYRGRALKRVVARANLETGQVLTETDIAMFRSADGTGAFRADTVIGKTLKRDIARHGAISEDDLT